jgi:hypothetical protein
LSIGNYLTVKHTINEDTTTAEEATTAENTALVEKATTTENA